MDRLGDSFETELRILPDGRVVIQDMDVELLQLAQALNPQDERLKHRLQVLATRRREDRECGETGGR